MKALLFKLYDRSAWAQPTTEVADTKVEGAAMDSDLLVCVFSACHCVGVHDK